MCLGQSETSYLTAPRGRNILDNVPRNQGGGRYRRPGYGVGRVAERQGTRFGTGGSGWSLERVRPDVGPIPTPSAVEVETYELAGTRVTSPILRAPSAPSMYGETGSASNYMVHEIW